MAESGFNCATISEVDSKTVEYLKTNNSFPSKLNKQILWLAPYTDKYGKKHSAQTFYIGSENVEAK